MRRAIGKYLRDFIAIILLFVIASAVAVVILSNQRLTLPGWVPVIGTEFYEIKAELSDAQAVTPGQGQTVDVAGVDVGDISKVELEEGKAVLTLRLKDDAPAIYRDARGLLRPKTGLKDMVLELEPGTSRTGRLKEGARIPVGQTLPDVDLDEILASLDGDTRQYLRVLLGDGGEALGGNGKALGDTLRRIEPLAADTRKLNEGLAERRRNIRRVMHNFSLLSEELGRRDDQLADFVDSSNAVFESFANQDANLRETLQELPSALVETRDALAKAETLGRELGPALQALRPGARALGPTLRDVRPFVRETTPIIRDKLRPFSREAQPAVDELRPAMRDLSAAAPDLTTSFEVLNKLLNTLAYNPPGKAEEGYLYWVSWLNHLANNIFTNQDAHGVIRRGLIIVNCNALDVLSSVATVNPLLGTLVNLLNAPQQSDVCPTSASPTARSGG
jgi:phospholipid/cholesterol/gamma-HCH transport system substrate-binding protein